MTKLQSSNAAPNAARNATPVAARIGAKLCQPCVSSAAMFDFIAVAVTCRRSDRDDGHDMTVMMVLFLQAFQPKNIYTNEYQFSGQSVAGMDSARFFNDRFTELVKTSKLSALTLDGVQNIWLSNLTRLAVVGEQDLYDKGLSDAALRWI